MFSKYFIYLILECCWPDCGFEMQTAVRNVWFDYPFVLDYFHCYIKAFEWTN